jgi:two-component system chemotaxis response regulator CheB
VAHRDVVAIGTSAGGIEALREIAAGLPADLSAAVLIVIHVPPESPGMLPSILSKAGPLPAAHASDGEELRAGRIYVAPADHHMIVDGPRVRLARGPRENLHRPAVDPMFRSVAVAYGPRAVGVILTGALDDGTAGLSAIKRMGGLAIVQDPATAMYPSMPSSARRNVRVDYSVSLAEIPPLLDRLTREPLASTARADAPEEMAMEVRMAENESNEEKLDRIGKRSTFTCPECHGTLWEIRESQVLRYRCHVGHAYNAETLIAQQSDALEDALWAAVRAFEENSKLSEKMAERSRSHGHDEVAHRFMKRADAAHSHAAEIRKLLERIEVLTEPSTA